MEERQIQALEPFMYKMGKIYDPEWIVNCSHKFDIHITCWPGAKCYGTQSIAVRHKPLNPFLNHMIFSFHLCKFYPSKSHIHNTAVAHWFRFCLSSRVQILCEIKCPVSCLFFLVQHCFPNVVVVWYFIREYIIKYMYTKTYIQIINISED